MSDGCLISLEGIDGSGKTTVADHLRDSLDDVVVTREPSDLWTGELVRDQLEDSQSNPFVTFFSFLVDRVHHIEEVIKPALQEGRTVVSDRYSDSSRAYQPASLTDYFGEGQSETQAYVNRVMNPFNLEPDLTLYLDISVDTAMERCDGKDKYETWENLQEVKENYDLINDLYEHRVEKIDGGLPLETVKSRCKTKVLKEVGE